MKISVIIAMILSTTEAKLWAHTNSVRQNQGCARRHTAIRQREREGEREREREREE